MRVWIFVSLLVFPGITSGCLGNLGTHAIQCAMVGEQKICFVREVWGFNGESLSLTTSDNVCHKPSSENDYVANRMRGDHVISAKVADGKFYVYAVPMKAPKNPFPVEVILENYDPGRHNKGLTKEGDLNMDLSEEGYQEFDLGGDKMTWCFTDLF